MKRGRLITFEGGEGSGKTTQIALLEDYLREKGKPLLCTREPGGTPLGDKIRHLILESPEDGSEVDIRTEFFLYLASRAQHVKEVLLPALAAGKLVFCDRFSDATLAYQGYGRGLPLEKIKDMMDFASYGLVPDLTLFFDITPDLALPRLSGRKEINRLDQEALSFHERVYRGYQTLIRDDAKRIAVIDATVSIEVVSRKIREKIDAFL
ncbi:Thymidylate kinase [hydrothermal vent metagenome]|uniref:dTMP kinase n=1 Tax=hydrothermal vent metagenome TaxID=652676 RepID=A0A3B1CWR1_9ZZZZ